MNATPSVVPILLGGLPLAVLYSVLLVNVRQRFGGIGIVVSAVVAVLMTVGFVAPQAFQAERDHPVLVVAFVAILFLALFGTPALVLWRAGQQNPPSVTKQVLYGVLAFYGGLVLGGIVGVLLMLITQATGGRAA